MCRLLAAWELLCADNNNNISGSPPPTGRDNFLYLAHGGKGRVVGDSDKMDFKTVFRL